MRLYCFHCGKPVTTELPNDTVFRGVATCPECIEKDYQVEQEIISRVTRLETDVEILKEQVYDGKP